MTDRYLFRGKREKDEQWEYGAFWQSNSSIIDKSGYSQKVIPKTIGQCTGLKDKNGKLIFENDILLFTDDDGEKSSYKVCWSEEYASYTIITFGAMADTMERWDEHGESFEIIGNVTDNPELLEVKE